MLALLGQDAVCPLSHRRTSAPSKHPSAPMQPQQEQVAGSHTPLTAKTSPHTPAFTFPYWIQQLGGNNSTLSSTPIIACQSRTINLLCNITIVIFKANKQPNHCFKWELTFHREPHRCDASIVWKALSVSQNFKKAFLTFKSLL